MPISPKLRKLKLSLTDKIYVMHIYTS